MNKQVVNVVVAGLGGQGVIKASDILAKAAFYSGHAVKKSELHGMSQRGGSVSSDVRFGAEVLSPMVPAGTADFLVVISPDQEEVNRDRLRAGGIAITPGMIDANRLANRKSLNVALLGVLSHSLELSAENWLAAIKEFIPEQHLAANRQAFEEGRRVAAEMKTNPA